MTFPSGSEDQIHYSIRDWLEVVVPGIEVVHVPNSFFAGTKDVDDLDERGKPKRIAEKKHIARLKALGLKPGALDLVCFPGAGRVFWIEVKTAKGVVRDEQKEFAARMDRLGIPWSICRSIEDARAFLQSLNIETREAA